MAEIRYLTDFITRRLTFGKKVMHAAFICIDSRGITWHVPEGSETDGESVPEYLEILIGDKFEGVTEVAAVVHDFYCVTKERLQKDTHRIFRDLTMYEMQKKYPLWQKPWQYSRAHIMWTAVRAWNRIKHPKWK